MKLSRSTLNAAILSGFAIMTAMPARADGQRLRGTTSYEEQRNLSLTAYTDNTNHLQTDIVYDLTEVGIQTPDRILIDLVETSFYDEPWPAFSTAEMFAYKAISRYFSRSTTDDIRQLYNSGEDERDMEHSWYADLGGVYFMNSLKQEVAGDGCDEFCCTNVVKQLLKEFQMVMDIYAFKKTMYKWCKEVSDYTIMELTHMGNLLGMDTDDLTPIPPPPETNWLDVFIEVATGLSAVSSVVPEVSYFFKAAEAVGYFIEALKGMEDDPTSPSDETPVFSENNNLDLDMTLLIQMAESTYLNIKLMHKNQVDVIAGNYGKLKNFQTRFYYGTSDGSGVLSEEAMGVFVETQGADNYFAYKAYAMLFPSKYNLCVQHQSWIDTSHHHKPLGTAKTMEDVLLVKQTEDDHSTPIQAVGVCDVHSSTVRADYSVNQLNKCDLTQFAWWCGVGSRTHGINPDVLGYYNTFLKAQGPSPSSQDDEITECMNDSGVCIINGITVPVQAEDFAYQHCIWVVALMDFECPSFSQ